MMNRVLPIRFRNGERNKMSDWEIRNKKDEIICDNSSECRERERLITIHEIRSEGEERHGGSTKENRERERKPKHT